MRFDCILTIAKILDKEEVPHESTCTSGHIADPVAAMACLANPAAWTGQTGSGATLRRVAKLDCVP